MGEPGSDPLTNRLRLPLVLRSVVGQRVQDEDLAMQTSLRIELHIELVLIRRTESEL